MRSVSAALADTAATVHAVPDVRIGTLLLERHVDVVVLGAAWLTEDGSLAGAIGVRGIAMLAKEARIPVVGVASSRMVVRGTHAVGAPPVGEREDCVPLELVDRRWLAGILSETGLGLATMADRHS